MINYSIWTEFKNLITSKNLLMQYHEFPYHYMIFASETSTLEYFTEIWKDTSKVEGIDVIQNNIDLVDFETNYKPYINLSPTGEDGEINVNVTGTSRVKLWDDITEVGVTEDNRLKVDAELSGITLSTIINECNIFLTDIFTIISKNEITIRTYTVPIGRIFRLVLWRMDADHPLAIDCNLKVNGVTKKKFYLDPSQGKDSDNFYTLPVIFATEGQVITITIEPTMPRGEINSVLVGIEL